MFGGGRVVIFEGRRVQGKMKCDLGAVQDVVVSVNGHISGKEKVRRLTALPIGRILAVRTLA